MKRVSLTEVFKWLLCRLQRAIALDAEVMWKIDSKGGIKRPIKVLLNSMLVFVKATLV